MWAIRILGLFGLARFITRDFIRDFRSIRLVRDIMDIRDRRSIGLSGI